MKRTTMALLFGGLLGGLFPIPSMAQDEADNASAFGTYEPSPAHPFGRPHPDAPPELEQFAFMIGAFDCVDEIRQQDGSWNRFPAVWNAYYFLNGHGIQDKYWAPTFSTSNLRIFDPTKGTWIVTFFKMPGYQSSVWEGVKERETMVMRQGGRTTGSGLPLQHLRKRLRLALRRQSQLEIFVPATAVKRFGIMVLWSQSLFMEGKLPPLHQNPSPFPFLL